MFKLSPPEIIFIVLSAVIGGLVVYEARTGPLLPDVDRYVQKE